MTRHNLHIRRSFVLFQQLIMLTHISKNRFGTAAADIFPFSFDRPSLILFSCPKLCTPLPVISCLCALCMLCYHSDNCDNTDDRQGQVTWSQPFTAVHNVGKNCAAVPAGCVSSDCLPSASSSHSKLCCYSTVNTFSE
jgi:hypothetical protein